MTQWLEEVASVEGWVLNGDRQLVPTNEHDCENSQKLLLLKHENDQIYLLARW